jgi:exodeoxyribonuclease VII small subunit
MSKKKITYAEAVAEIEQILSRLKSEQIDVDRLSAEVKRATELIAQCKARLVEVEATVKAQLSEE